MQTPLRRISSTSFQSGLRAAGRIALVLVGLGLLIAVIAWLAGAFETKIPPNQVKAPARKVKDQRTDIVHEVTKDYVEEAIGTLKAASRSVISSKVLATIESISVAAGSQVKKGDVLIELDNKEFKARVKQAEQVATAAAATFEQSKANYNRTLNLFVQKAVSQSELDEAKQKYLVAQADAAKAKQALNEATVLLSYTTIAAPRNGRIVDRRAEAGDTVAPGQPILILYDAASLRLEAPVLEHLAVKLRLGDKFNVYIDALKKTFKATVDEIVPQADVLSRSFLVRVTLPRKEGLYEGMFGRLQIPAGKRRHLCLAAAAVRRIGQLEFVDVVLPSGIVERRFIRTGRAGFPGRLEVLSGLQAGERVILHGDAP